MASSNAANTNVSVSASANVTVLAANSARQLATIYNDGAATVYLSYGPTASSTSYSLQVAPNGYVEVPFAYNGIITHQGSSATGTLRCTEL